MDTKKYYIAIETGGTKLQLVLGDSEGSILERRRSRINGEDGRKGILDQIHVLLPQLLQSAGERGITVSKIGVGFGGPVDTPRGIAIGSAQIKDWDNFPLAEYLTEKTGIPTQVFNDSNAAVWGEYCRGSGQGSRIFFYTNIGSGVGGGIVIDGKLFDGQGTGAAEFGQTYMYNPNPVEGCRYPVNHLELICSGWSIQKRLRSDDIPADSILPALAGHKQEEITCEMWGEAIRQNDAYSLQVLDEISEYFAIGLCSMICFYSPEVIAIGGGISLIGDPLISRIDRYVEKYVYRNNLGKYRIEKSRLDEDVVLIGTLLLLNEES